MGILKATAALLTVALTASAEQPWVTVATGELTVKARTIPGTTVREILAERDVAAPASAVARAVTDVARFPAFMPYVKEARLVGAPGNDGSRVVYTSLQVPLIAGRDFVIVDRVVKALASDGSGEFISAWEATDRLPRRSHLVRLKVNTGSWKVTSLPGGKSHVVYRFAVDPGGQIPGWLADIGNQRGVPDVFRAVEKEAQRLHAGR